MCVEHALSILHIAMMNTVTPLTLGLRWAGSYRELHRISPLHTPTHETNAPP